MALIWLLTVLDTRDCYLRNYSLAKTNGNFWETPNKIEFFSHVSTIILIDHNWFWTTQWKFLQNQSRNFQNLNIMLDNQGLLITSIHDLEIILFLNFLFEFSQVFPCLRTKKDWIIQLRPTGVPWKNLEPYAKCGSTPAHTPWCASKQKRLASNE